MIGMEDRPSSQISLREAQRGQQEPQDLQEVQRKRVLRAEPAMLYLPDLLDLYPGQNCLTKVTLASRKLCDR